MNLFSKKILIISALITFSFVSICQSQDRSIIRHDVPDSLYINLAANFPAVGAITIYGDPICSCTLIADDMILTAAHCLDDNADGIIDYPTEMSNALIKFGANTDSFIESVAVELFYIFPQWYQSGQLNRKDGNDIALIKLASPVTTIVPMQISLQNPVDFIGTTIGFGMTGTGNDDTTTVYMDGKKRAVQNLIEFKSPLGTGYAEFGALHGDFDKVDGSTNTMEQFMLEFYGITHVSPAIPLDLEGFGAPGDSGGPLTADFDNGNGAVIVGIASASFNPIDESRPWGYGAIDIWSSFMNPTVSDFFTSHGISVIAATSVAKGDSKPLIFYPNPAQNIIYIENFNFNEIDIINITGQVIKKKINNNTIDVSNLKSGFYFIKTINGNYVKLIINR